MEEEKVVELTMRIISNSGESKGFAFDAISKAKSGEFEEAENIVNDASQCLADAHKLHFELLQMESNNELDKITILITHAQDHFMAAMTAVDQAKEWIAVYKEISQLKDLLK